MIRFDNSTRIFSLRRRQHSRQAQASTSPLLLEEQQRPRRSDYNPELCRTCQTMKLDNPRPARTKYSDCEDHYRERMLLLSQRCVEIIIRRR